MPPNAAREVQIAGQGARPTHDEHHVDPFDVCVCVPPQGGIGQECGNLWKLLENGRNINKLCANVSEFVEKLVDNLLKILENWCFFF